MNIRWRWWCTMLCMLVLTDVMMVRGDDDHDRDVPTALDGADSDADNDDLPLRTEESRNVHPRAYQSQSQAQGGYNALPSGFRPSVGAGGGAASLAELAGYTRPRPAAIRQQPADRDRDRDPELDQSEEEEREEPDRLAQLLQQSRFDCSAKQTGYYADQELQCEVFHYCQDNVKHSWICPDGFTFHQVHLICMPPTQDNICQQSAKYHFVNEYLYRPVNEEEVQRKPNVPLRYSDRYYPAEVYHDDRNDDDDDDDDDDRRQRQEVVVRASPRPTAAVSQTSSAPAQQQVFRSAEEVNIPLVQRRPQRPYDFRF